MARKNKKSGKKTRSSAPKVRPKPQKTNLKWVWWVIAVVAAIFIISSFTGGNNYPDIYTERPVRGAENAEVVITEFSDLECPACRQMHPVLQRAMQDYEGEIAWEFKHFPLNYHPNARIAARAVECANDQGVYWELIDTIYENQNQLSKSNLLEWGFQLGLNESYEDCINSDVKNKIIDADIRDAQEKQVGGTPTIFVNGKRLSNLGYESLSNLIEAELR